MDAWGDIRLKARTCHGLALTAAKGDRRGPALLAAALETNDLEISFYDEGEKAGPGVLGFLERSSLMVNIARGQNADDELVVTAHEFGHFILHTDASSEVTNVQPSLGGDPIDSGAGRVEGYSSRERKEVQADVFAGEFLCPADWLRHELVEGGKRPREVAEALGLPVNLVLNQSIRALLLPPLNPPSPEAVGISYELDDSQKEAATWKKGPLLVDAGPGTGKTRTLVHRVGDILDSNGSAASILALTFSNKAAEEMRERISVSHPEAAIEMWVGTFHAFGLELITKWPGRIGRTDKVKIYDQTASLALLEANLSKLPLRYYQNLFEPAFELVHVLQAISRCKDELIGPDEYIAEAKLALVGANDDEREAAERALEIGEIYKFYERALMDDDAVDFGGLVMYAAQMLEDHQDIREQYAIFQHILVDEYQDVNFASAKLLQMLARTCNDIWVVADQRQSIYRFRGAEPSNCTRFTDDFPEAQKRSLGHNYRSGSPVVHAFETFSQAMSSGGVGTGWVPQRGDLGEVSLTIGETLADEAVAIRDKVEELRGKGVRYRDQVVLARSHLTLARITGILEKLNVPLLYLGDVFEREEIRDLLSLVAIDAEFGGIGLVRVAQLPEYAATKEDALGVLQWARENDATVFQALAQSDAIPALSPQGRLGLARLAHQLAGLGPETSPWTLLTTWLFERSAYLQPLLASDDPKSRQKLIAIYQVLKVAGEHSGAGDKSRKRFLERIRRIESLNQDTIYRAVASEATDIDAVRVMTIHGSKGLEFGAVHLPALATRYMPSNRQATRCPPPPGLARLAMAKPDHDAEEECLFFVGLSRARDYLCLSRAERYTQQNASPSRFLQNVGRAVPSQRRSGQTQITADEPVLTPPPPQERYDERELATYLRCPARYKYEVLDGLRGGRDGSAYLGFHRCVYRTLAWLETERAAGRPANPAAALAQLNVIWQSAGPVGHGFEAYYRTAANDMVSAIATLIESEVGTYVTGEWVVALAGREVTITPDRAVQAADGSVRVQRMRTGRKTKSEPDNRIYALLRRAAEQAFPGRSIQLETYYPSLKEAVPIPARKDAKLLDEYADAIRGIESGAFASTPADPRQCPNCQCYFICGI